MCDFWKLIHSITKEILQQSKKEILEDVKKQPNSVPKKNLEIDIDDGADYEV